MKIRYFVLAIVVLFAGCSKESEKELFDKAQKNFKENKFAEAVKNYELLAENYPEGSLASSALYEAGRIYQGGLIKELQIQKSFEKAVDLYVQVFEKYPKSKEAAGSMFMAAYLQANELKQYDKAKINYEKFIRLFPDDEMVQAAKEELNNIGLTPEQILEKRISSK